MLTYSQAQRRIWAAPVLQDMASGKLHHAIHTGYAPPIRQPVRRIPPFRRQEVQKLLGEMLAKDVIQRSTSPWASPIVLVKKKDGPTRFCVDYLKLNEVTRKDAYPLPRIDATLDTLVGSRWFSTLDLLSGYWQVEVAERDQPKTAFCTTEGLFEFQGHAIRAVQCPRYVPAADGPCASGSPVVALFGVLGRHSQTPGEFEDSVRPSPRSRAEAETHKVRLSPAQGPIPGAYRIQRWCYSGPSEGGESCKMANTNHYQGGPAVPGLCQLLQTSGVGRGGAHGARAPPLYLRLYKKCTRREGSCSS